MIIMCSNALPNGRLLLTSFTVFLPCEKCKLYALKSVSLFSQGLPCGVSTNTQIQCFLFSWGKLESSALDLDLRSKCGEPGRVRWAAGEEVLFPLAPKHGALYGSPEGPKSKGVSTITQYR